VFFTGSYATGRKIAETVAGRMIKVQLELGGKDPIYICEDVNVKSAAEGTADGAMYNAGQSCCSVERIYVHEKIHDTFVEEFLKAVKGFKIGDPTDDRVTGRIEAFLDGVLTRSRAAAGKTVAPRTGGDRDAD
jgi:acyl-CoA reductase-like NAD-dependent aldehyde dehydrogenase